jgi:hypothetical protein
MMPAPEFMWMMTPSGGTVVVARPGDTLNIVDLLPVTDSESKPGTCFHNIEL